MRFLLLLLLLCTPAYGRTEAESEQMFIKATSARTLAHRQAYITHTERQAALAAYKAALVARQSCSDFGKKHQGDSHLSAGERLLYADHGGDEQAASGEINYMVGINIHEEGNYERSWWQFVFARLDFARARKFFVEDELDFRDAKSAFKAALKLYQEGAGSE